MCAKILCSLRGVVQSDDDDKDDDEDDNDDGDDDNNSDDEKIVGGKCDDRDGTGPKLVTHVIEDKWFGCDVMREDEISWCDMRCD